MDNLIKLNGNLSNIIINSETLNIKKTKETIKFKQPYPNDCLAIIAQDYSEGLGLLITVGGVSKTGFTVQSEQSMGWISYFAIGY